MVTTENGNGGSKDELLQRLELMETMIAEGRRATGRYGWVFVLWGVVYFAAMGWVVFLPHKNWAWVTCVLVGYAFNHAFMKRQRAYGDKTPRSRAIAAVWIAMGISIWIYGIGAGIGNHLWLASYVAPILIFLGMANAISAMILRWKVQGVAAAIWYAGGFATFFATQRQSIAIFLTATFFGMILFGLYAMMQERQRAKLDGSPMRHNA
jgi:hypothetical protein